MRDLTLRSLRGHVALLLQDAPLFDGTVRENVAYGRPGASDAEVAPCARGRRARGRVAGRAAPRARASAAARCRAASAAAWRWRARCSRTRACSCSTSRRAGLDAEATRRLVAPLRRLMAGRATLLITHDPILIAAADEVVELRDGRVTAPELAA